MHADDANVGAGGNEFEAVFSFTATERPHARAKANEELRDLHAVAFRHQEMAHFVEKYRRNDGHNQDKQPDTRERNPTQQGQKESEQNELVAEDPLKKR